MGLLTKWVLGGFGFKAQREQEWLHRVHLCTALMSRNACNGENGETGEKSSAADNLNWMPKVAPWRLAILAKMAKMAKLAKNHQPLAI